MTTFATLTAMDGSSVRVNPELVVALTPIPAAQLPSGVTDGTLVRSCDSPDLPVRGTVAATMAALAATAGVVVKAYVDGATGNIVSGSGITFNRTGAGVYDGTLSDGALATGGLVLATLNETGEIRTGGVVAGGSTFTVRTFDSAGAATDKSFAVYVVTL